MPQPIDVQTELARVTTIERVQQISDRLSLAAHQRVSEQAEKQHVLAETQAQQAEQKSEQVERDSRRQDPPNRRKPRKPAEPSAESVKAAPMPPAAHEEHRLDISI